MHANLYRNDPPQRLLRHTAKPDNRLGRSQYRALPDCVRVAPCGRYREWLECPVGTWETLGWELASHFGFDRCGFCAPRWGDDWDGDSYPATRSYVPVSRMRFVWSFEDIDVVRFSAATTFCLVGLVCGSR